MGSIFVRSICSTWNLKVAQDVKECASQFWCAFLKATKITFTQFFTLYIPKSLGLICGVFKTLVECSPLISEEEALDMGHAGKFAILICRARVSEPSSTKRRNQLLDLIVDDSMILTPIHELFAYIKRRIKWSWQQRKWMAYTNKAAMLMVLLRCITLAILISQLTSLKQQPDSQLFSTSCHYIYFRHPNWQKECILV